MRNKPLWLFMLTGFFTPQACANPFWGLGLQSSISSFAPISEEATTNAYSLGPKIFAGFLLEKFFWGQVFLSYQSGHFDTMNPATEETSLAQGGLALGARISRFAFISLEGGQSIHHIVTVPTRTFEGRDNLVEGQREGVFGGLTLGAIQEGRKGWFEVAFGFTHHEFRAIKKNNEEIQSKRSLDLVFLSLARGFL